MSKQLFIALFVAFGILSVLPASAQSTFGSIRGSTQDQTGAVIAQAPITLHSVDENTDVVTNSDSEGNFLFANVKPGNYRLTATKEGFANAVVDKVGLTARQDIRLDLKFALAATTQEAVVIAEAVAVNTENATLADSVNNTDLAQLPINSRSVSSSPLAALALSASVTTDTQGNISVGGATAAQTGFAVDGISTASVRSNGALQDSYPSMENIAEMKITAFNNNAEFAQIGDVTFVTKSGTNQLHGSAFEYFQDSGLDANVLNFTTKAPRTFNTFGGSLGGTVTIPKLYNGKDKTFFFLDYEGNRKTQSYPEQLLVPTAAERSGNLSALVAGVGHGPLMNPFTGAPFPNNMIPAGSCPACINPVAQAVLNYYPLPNANLGIPNPSYNYQTLAPNPSNSNALDLRLDHNFNPRQQLYVRFSLKNAFYTEFNQAGVIAPAQDFLPSDGAYERNRSLVVSYNYAITPRLLNEFRFGFTNYNENDTFPIEGAQAISKLGLILNDGINLAAHPTGDAFPTFNFADGSITPIGQDRVGSTISATTQFTDNVTLILGKHTFRFGLDARRQRYNALMFYYPSDEYGDFTFSGSLTGYSFGDFLLGLPNPSFFAITSPQVNANNVHWGVYGQDTWQVNSRLTVNFGLRWELLPPFIESSGDLASFLPATNSIVIPNALVNTIANNPLYQRVYNGFLESFNACSLPNRNTALACSNVVTASQAGIPQGLRNWNWHDYDPRVSVAWRPFNDNKTVIRAGVGLFTATSLGPLSFNNAGNPLSDLLYYNNSVTNGIAAFHFPQTAAPGPIPLGGGSLEEANNPNWKDPTSAQWSLTMERQLTQNSKIRLSYVGMSTWHLPITVDLNQIAPSANPYTVPANGWVDPRAPYQNWLLLMDSETMGNQSYQSGIAEFQQRFGHGLSFQATYTFTKDISDAQGTDAPAVFAGEEPYAVEIANRYDIKYDRGNVVGLPTQRFLLTGAYQLPFGAGRTWLNSSGRLVNAVVGGWNLSTVTTIQSGQWLTATMPAADDQSNTDMIVRVGGGAVARPDCVGNPYADQTSQNFFNINAFALPPANAGRFGSCGLGNLQGPGMINVNMGVAKVFQITERARLRFEATFTNVLNHTNFAPPAMNIGNPSTFGVLQAALPQGNGGNRTGQLALRFDF